MKVSALTSLAASSVDGTVDQLLIADISAGQSKKISRDNLLSNWDGDPNSPVVYLPNQTSFSGSVSYGGNGLRNLSHASGEEGYDNLAFGKSAGLALTTGRANILIGTDTGKALTAATVVNTYSGTLGNSGNVWVGRTIGAAANGALDTVFIGTNAGQNFTSGMDSVGIGANAAANLEGGSETVALGHGTLQHVVGSGDFATGTGHRLTAVGDMAGRFLNSLANKTSGKSSLYLGARTRSLANGAENEIVIGYDVDGGGSNTVTIGNSSILTTTLFGNLSVGNAAGDKINADGYIKSLSGFKLGTGVGLLIVDSEADNAFTIAADNGNEGANSYIRFAVDFSEQARITPSRTTFEKPIGLKGYTVATLPAGGVGDTAYVTDATAPTYLGALTGGGAVTCPVFYNGSAWVSA